MGQYYWLPWLRQETDAYFLINILPSPDGRAWNWFHEQVRTNDKNGNVGKPKILAGITESIDSQEGLNTPGSKESKDIVKSQMHF